MNIDILYKVKNILEEDIKNNKNGIFYKEEILKECIKEIQQKCDHKIITDSIDLLEGYKECVTIKYCEKCEKTF